MDPDHLKILEMVSFVIFSSPKKRTYVIDLGVMVLDFASDVDKHYEVLSVSVELC